MFNKLDNASTPGPRGKGITAYLRTLKAGEVIEVPPELRKAVHAAANNCGMKIATRVSETGMVNFYVLEPAGEKKAVKGYSLTAELRKLRINDRVDIPGELIGRLSQAAKNLHIEVVSEKNEDGTYLVERLV